MNLWQVEKRGYGGVKNEISRLVLKKRFIVIKLQVKKSNSAPFLMDGKPQNIIFIIQIWQLKKPIGVFGCLVVVMLIVCKSQV